MMKIDEIKACVREEIDRELELIKENLENYKRRLDKTVTEQVNKFQKEKEKYVEQNNLLTDVPNDDQTGIDHDMITAVESGEKFNFQSRSFFLSSNK